jgi:hypothetical protein
MRAYEVRGHPTVLIFDRHGQETQRFTGPQPAEAIEQVLQATISGN